MSQLLKQAEGDFELTITEHDIQDSLGKFSRSMSKEEIARFNKIYAQRDAQNAKSLLKQLPPVDMTKSKQIQH
jgi:hypothetical protein